LSRYFSVIKSAGSRSPAPDRTVEPVSGHSLRADARRNRALILAAAEEAFGKDGVGVPVDEIARRAGVGAGTLYRHFPTKEALFEAVLLEHMTKLAAEARRLATRSDPGQALFDYLLDLGHEAGTKRNLMEALSGAGIDIKEAAAAQKEEIEREFQHLLDRAQAAGQVRSDVTLQDLFGLVVGTCAFASEEAGACSQSRMLAVVCDGLRPHPEPGAGA
jgi:AcrR family transcriptional regulator